MNLLSGITERTIKSFQLNAGVLLKEYTKGGAISESNIIGATRGGGSFTAVPTIHQIAVDGAPINTMGLERIDEWVVTLNTTMVETTEETIKMALVASNTTTVDVTDKKITADNEITADHYTDVYWVGNTSSGKNIVIHLKNVINTNGFNLTIADKGEGTFAITLVAHYSISDLEHAPFDITFEG